QEMHVADAGVGGVLRCEREHLVGHVETVGDAGRPDALRREDHVDAAAGAEVQDGLALAQLGHGGRVAAAERGERRGLGQLAALLGVVERLAEHRRVTLSVGAAGATPAAAVGSVSFGDGAGRLGVAAAHLLAQLIGGRSHQQHTPFRSATAASFSTASRFNEKYAHLPRCSRSSSPASVSFFRWCDTVGCERPSGSYSSHAQTGSPLVASRFTTRTPAGSASALNSSAVAAPPPAASLA